MIEWVVATSVSCLCMILYLPILSVGIIHTRLRRATPNPSKGLLHRAISFSDTAAVVYGLSEALQGGVVVFGALLTLSTRDLRYVLVAFAIGWVIEFVGFRLALKMELSERMPDSYSPAEPPFIIEGRLVDDDTPDDE